MAIYVVRNMNEKEKRDRFHRLFENRARNVLESLRVLGHCSNSSLYSYEQAEVKEVFSVIEKELKRIKIKFEKPATLEVRFRK